MRVARKVWDFGANALGTKNSSGVKTPEEVKADYYADKYKDVGGVRKAVTGIVGSTIATVPVVVETLSAAAKSKKIGKTGQPITAQRRKEIVKSDSSLKKNLRKGIGFESGRESALYLMEGQ